MSDPAVAAQRQQQRQQGLIAGLITLPFRFFGVLCGALLLCILQGGNAGLLGCHFTVYIGRLDWLDFHLLHRFNLLFFVAHDISNIQGLLMRGC